MHGSRNLNWTVHRRLAQLRKDLHDPVKSELGETYKKQFGGASFAHVGGLPGTTTRLRGWFQALAASINNGCCPPNLAGLTLSFLEIPEPPSLTGSTKSTATLMAHRVREKISIAKESVRERAVSAHKDAQDAAARHAGSFAKQNPQAAKTAAFKMMKSNPKMAMQVMKL